MVPKCKPKKSNIEIPGSGHFKCPVKGMNTISNPEGKASRDEYYRGTRNDPHLSRRQIYAERCRRD